MSHLDRCSCIHFLWATQKRHYAVDVCHFSAGFHYLWRWVVTVILGLSNSISNNMWRSNDQIQSSTTKFKFNKSGFIFWRSDGYETRVPHMKLNSILSSSFAVVNKVGTVRLLILLLPILAWGREIINVKKSNVEQIWILVWLKLFSFMQALQGFFDYQISLLLFYYLTIKLIYTTFNSIILFVQ